ncbi:phosphoribosylglycinamide formyltransferase [Arcobacter sp. 15-2]|uniref:phosphoribosylglycinamide formyltransferase n=1 Tax=Arcobacter sp. 15-2 TaxID=3374109 RepID=UPI00399CD100
MIKKIGILSSHNGSGYVTIDKACKNNSLNAQVVVVVSNNSKANVLKTAEERKTPNFVINNKLFPNEDLDEKITSLFVEYECDYIFLSGYMKKLETKLITQFENKIVNSHPALLPKFGGKGMYGRFVHEAVIESQEKESGVTIHFVNEEYDKGEFILQKKLTISDNCTVEELENDIKKLESIAIVEAFESLI